MIDKRLSEEKNLSSIRMKVEQFLQQAGVELQCAREAQDIGNEGKARTGARRAAGSALSALKQRFPDRNYGDDVMRQLRNLMDDATVPVDAREAAERLQARITEQFTPPFATDPIADAVIILNYVKKCLHDTQ